MSEIQINTPPNLVKAIHSLLLQHPDGLKEIDLFHALHDSMPDIFSKDAFRDSLALFRVHFILFNALYLLRRQLSQTEQGFLDIGQLIIQLQPWPVSHNTQIGVHDPMEAYYLNLKNLQETDRSEIERMLSGFWEKFLAQNNTTPYLKILELPVEVSWDEIKRRYQQLSMQHHPDRGGDTQRYQQINEAYTNLKKAYL